MEPPGDPKGSPGGFSVSKNFDTLLKNPSIFSRGCRPLRALRRVKVRTVRPGLTARVHSAPLPLLSQTNPLHWALFGFPVRTLVAREVCFPTYTPPENTI